MGFVSDAPLVKWKMKNIFYFRATNSGKTEIIYSDVFQNHVQTLWTLIYIADLYGLWTQKTWKFCPIYQILLKITKHKVTLYNILVKHLYFEIHYQYTIGSVCTVPWCFLQKDDHQCLSFCLNHEVDPLVFVYMYTHDTFFFCIHQNYIELVN